MVINKYLYFIFYIFSVSSVKKIFIFMARKKTEENIEETKYPRIIMGLDVSTVCIGVSIVADYGEGKPEIIKITHVSPKVSKKIKGIEALLLRKNIFEKEFLSTLTDSGITDVVIEEPLISSNNAVTVATLLRYNGMICESVYRVLGIVPTFISSYDARTYSFPDLLALRKYTKKGTLCDLKSIRRCAKDNHVVLFGAYPYDVDKKMVMMNKVDEMYDNIQWILNKDGEIKKENYDACDSLVCALAYINVNRHGLEEPKVTSFCSTSGKNENTVIEYTMEMWGQTYERTMILDD